jgi:hypothetical protein
MNVNQATRFQIGRMLLFATGAALTVAGLFACWLGVTKQFLPHEVAFLGMTPRDLCARNECRIVHFMIHDRIAFGGAVTAIGILYLWLAGEPLRRGERWAWRVVLTSGLVGFASFLTYLGYGYLDTWHAAVSLVLLISWSAGLALTQASCRTATPPSPGGEKNNWGYRLLLVSGLALVAAGSVILAVGTTLVFVPQDLAYMGITPAELDAINPRLIPLIAHDRAGFGGAVACCGLTMAGCIVYGWGRRGLLTVLGLAGAIGFGAAIGVHPAIGYNDWVHTAPAIAGAAVFFTGWLLSVRRSSFSSRTTGGDNRLSPHPIPCSGL